MKRGANNVLFIICMLAALPVKPGSPAWIVGTRTSAAETRLPLPPQAVIRIDGKYGQQGTVPLSLRSAIQHWDKRLLNAGWQLPIRQVLPGKRARESVHSVWSLDDMEIMLLLVSERTGSTFFIWHLSHPDKEKP